MGEQHSHLDDVVQAGPARPENGLAIRQGLSCLVLDRVSGEVATTRVDADDAETSTWGAALTPWLYSGELGAFGVVMICRGMVDLPVLLESTPHCVIVAAHVEPDRSYAAAGSGGRATSLPETNAPHTRLNFAPNARGKTPGWRASTDGSGTSS